MQRSGTQSKTVLSEESAQRILQQQEEQEEQKIFDDQFKEEDDVDEKEMGDLQNQMVKKLIVGKKKEEEKQKGKSYRKEKIDADALQSVKDMFLKDENGRTIIHRLSLEQRGNALKEVLNTFSSEDHNSLLKRIEEKDAYGNTPLGLACIYDLQKGGQEQEQELNLDEQRGIKAEDEDGIGQEMSSRLEVVLILLTAGANCNVYNKNTFWTPLHWAARYGDLNVVKAILSKEEAQEYIPDKNGFFPIDYAGFFGHYAVVKFLIQQTLKKIALKTPLYLSERILDRYVESNGRAGPNISDITNQLMLYNPIFHTSMLYWSATFDQIPMILLQSILNSLEAYPEGPIGIHYDRTPCHAAACVGNIEKLKCLLNDINMRHAFARNQKEESKAQPALRAITKRQQLAQQLTKLEKVKKKNPCPNYEARWAVLMKQRHYVKLKAFYEKVFVKKMLGYANLPKIAYDYVDEFYNTPLHLSSQQGHSECVRVLIKEYGLSLDVRNAEGWHPKDLLQHEDVRLVYEEHLHQSTMAVNSNLITLAVKNPQQKTESQEEVKQLLTNSKTPQQQSLVTRIALSKQIVKYFEVLTKTPYYILKVNNTKPETVSKMVSSLTHAGFIVNQLQSAANQNHYYLTLEMSQEWLDYEAKRFGLQVKLADVMAKIPYDPEMKVRFEPFRSKDKQIIISMIVKKILNEEQMRKCGILIKITLMHDYKGINDVLSKWNNHHKFIPMPLPLMKEHYNEGMDLAFTELSAYKNYFGEKQAFILAFKVFFTTWMIFPSACGLIISVYQFMAGVDTIYTSIYAIVISVWMTVFIERWKRKQAEISTKWGLCQLIDDLRKMRPEYCGDERYSKKNHEVDKKNKSIKGLMILLLSIITLLILISMTMVCYYLSEIYKDQKNEELQDQYLKQQIVATVIGSVYGVVVTIINYIYQFLSVKFVWNENHKYQDAYENSFVYKLFIFKFINTNISLFYLAFWPIDYTGKTQDEVILEKQTKFNDLFTLLLGMVLQKGATILFMKGPYKWAFLWWFKRSYFKTIEKNQREQVAPQQESNQKALQLPDQSHDVFEMNSNLEKQDPKSPTPLNQTAQDVKVVNKDLHINKIFIDTVEINCLMPVVSELSQLNYIQEFFIMVGFATLYAAVCPIVSFIVFLFAIFDINVDVYANLKIFQRPFQQERKGIGPWRYIIEILSVATVICNALLIYVTSGDFDSVFESQTGVTFQLWVMLGVEHFIIALKVFLANMIKDRPSWVEKSMKKIEYQIDMIKVEQGERDEKEKIEELDVMLKKFQKSYTNILDVNKYLKKELEQKRALINQFKSQGMIPENVSAELSETKLALAKLQKEQEMRSQGPLSLSDFLNLKSSEWLGNQRKEEMDKFLNRNLIRQLLKATFHRLEREIITSRVTRINKTRTTTMINCIQCTSARATFECINCLDHYCEPCSKQIHALSEAYQDHTIIPIPQTKEEPASIMGEMEQKTQGGGGALFPLWKKFEYFNFPLDQQNDQYQYLQQHYLFLKQEYIFNNSIVGSDSLDLPSLFLQEKYDILTAGQAKELKDKRVKLYGEQSAQKCEPMSQYFNDEELLYMNRVAFYLYKYKGDNLTFEMFKQRLFMLQNKQTFTKQLSFWLSLLDEHDEDQIARPQLERFLRLAFVQDVNFKARLEEVLDKMFGVEGLSEGEQKLNVGRLIKAVEEKEELKEFMMCVLQTNY